MRLVNILDIGRSNFGANPCIATTGTSNEISILTYASGWLALQEHLQWLRKALAGRCEDVVVAYLSSNSGDMLLSMLAATELGVHVALLNTRWTASEIAGLLQTQVSTCNTVILYGNGFYGKAKQAADALLHSTDIRHIPALAESYMTLGHPMEFQLNKMSLIHVEEEKSEVMFAKDGDDDAFVVFTSGTTSGSKGVRLSHRALWLQALAKLGPPCQYSSHTRMLATTVPLFHVGGLSSAIAVWLAGGMLEFPRRIGFDPKITVMSMSRVSMPTNTLVVVPAMLHALFQNIGENKCFNAVDLILIGGQSATPPMVRQLTITFPNARLVQTYACTEAASSLTFLLLDTLTENRMEIKDGTVGDCIGQPPPHIVICLVSESGTSVINEHEKVGTFATKGHHVMNGYWKRGDYNKYPSKGRNEWFITSDLGFKDATTGRFFFCGRATDVIRTGGETVNASEVERVLLIYDGVKECAVFALPDDRFGEAVCAALVAPDQSASLSQIRHFCGEQGLSDYKRPRRLFFLDELPRNSSGKVVKHMLVERFGPKQSISSKL